MRQPRIWQLIVAALFVFCFGLAANLDVWFQSWQGSRTQNADVLGVLVGDGRRLFARHFFVKADAYFHSGYYPTVFDNRDAFKTPHVAEDSGTVAGRNQGDEAGFLGKPRDWIDAFGRDFLPPIHTHLDQGGALKDLGDSSQVREILPWLRLSAELNPNDIQIYTVTAYWLRRRMGKADEAEQFLREGLRANPDSYEILFELGQVFAENRNDPSHARNLWEAALHSWQQQESGKTDPDKYQFIQIMSHLSKLEEDAGNYGQAIQDMQLWKTLSPTPAAVQKQIDQLRGKLSLSEPRAVSAAVTSKVP